jgi:GTP-binding protein LepA
MNDDRISRIRNFIIIAHVDHGKSTLSDAILKLCNAPMPTKIASQVLDDLPLEQEKGVTIKSNCVTLEYNGYIFNLIDSPGHRDFDGEIKVAVKLCESAILLVDATCGVSARTLATLQEAKNENLHIIPVINKIDVAEPYQIDQCMMDLMNLGFDMDQVVNVSGKTGAGVDVLLNRIIMDCPAPFEHKLKTKSAVVLDCLFDKHIGVRIIARVLSGVIKVGDKLRINDCNFTVVDLKIKTPVLKSVTTLSAGEFGHIITQIKNPRNVSVGDMIIDDKDVVIDDGLVANMNRFKTNKPKPMVFCVAYPEDSTNGEKVKDILEKYSLNDWGFSFDVQIDTMYGMCFKCGFRGLFHMEVVFARLEMEYNCSLVQTMPNVKYKIYEKNGSIHEISSAYDWLDESLIDYVEEPMAECVISVPEKFLGNIYALCMDKRATDLVTDQTDMQTPYGPKYTIKCSIPLAEIIVGLHDKISGLTSGYGDFDYNQSLYVRSDVGELYVHLNGIKVPTFSTIVHTSSAERIARRLVHKILDVIPGEQIEIKIQALLRGRILARETKRPYRKDVTAHCYGGDRTRKMKLLEQQKRGKERMQEAQGEGFSGRIDTAKLAREVFGNDDG